MVRNYDHSFKSKKGSSIFVPTKESRAKGKEICGHLLEKWTPPDHFYHFKSGGHIAALSVHQDSLYLSKVDIQKFFPTISRSRIIRVLKGLKIPFARAKEFAEWSCVISKVDKEQKTLPFGFIQSQLIASICLDRSLVGRTITDLISDQIKITVYVDDIIMSSNQENLLENAYTKILAAFSNSGFTLNKTKSHGPQKFSQAFNIDFLKNDMRISDQRFDLFIKALSSNDKRKSEAIISYVDKVSPTQSEILTKYFSDT